MAMGPLTLIVGRLVFAWFLPGFYWEIPLVHGRIPGEIRR